jgi:hypothetical protein
MEGIITLFSYLLHKLLKELKEVIVRKNATRKESSREKSHVQDQGLMTGSSWQAGWGKMVQH